MKNLKGWSKLTLQIIGLSASMMLISFFTDSQIWLDHFNYKAHDCHGFCQKEETHHHWNYRGFVYSITGLVFFIMSAIRIGLSHKEEDFTS